MDGEIVLATHLAITLDTRAAILLAAKAARSRRRRGKRPTNVRDIFRRAGERSSRAGELRRGDGGRSGDVAFTTSRPPARF